MATFGEWTETHVRALRAAYRMDQAKFAKVLGCSKRSVIRWEHGGPVSGFYQSVLDTMLVSAADPVRQRFKALIGGEEDDVQRRDFLAVTTATALTTLGVAATPPALLSEIGRPDTATIGNLRSILYSAMTLDDTLGASVAQGPVIESHRITEALLSDCPDRLRPAFLALNGEITGFAGCLAFDLGDYRTAARLYHLGWHLAHEAEDSDLAGYMLCHMSQLALWQGQPRVGIDHAVAARAWLADSEDITLRSYAAVRAAHAYAKAGNASACLAALDDAHADIDRCSSTPQLPADSKAYFHGLGLLWSYRGECLGLVGRPKEAAEATRKSLSLIAQDKIRDRAMSLLDLHRALLRLGAVDAAAAAIGEAVQMTSQHRSRRLAAAIARARSELAPWADAAAVQALDAELTAHDIVAL
ncbi:helix-turn-helix domain-containing protein [Nocardia transvalensis]|uniref:helix-turn-helix domain-containing protein n=1 Tax=Nocardia transvalensis TaxID=37333 RepID=UPI001892F91D|nr:helix-turn-helix transcriptional regulator [Nocardia transvalensis]MBF6333461.1 helix-turn-helix transcriptional regulator [Nocardia transvalensis]